MAVERITKRHVNELEATVVLLSEDGTTHNNLGAVDVENPLRRLGQSQSLKIKLTCCKKAFTSYIGKAFLKQAYCTTCKRLQQIQKTKKFDDFMARMAEDVQEAPKLKMPKTRNPVASHAQSSGSGVHADQNKKKQPMRKDKHKKQLRLCKTESIKEMLYRKLNAKK